MIKLVRESSKIPMEFICTYFGVSASGYYFWRKKPERIHFLKKEEVCHKIKDIFSSSKGTYGSPRVYKELREIGVFVSENTVSKYMQELGLDARLKKSLVTLKKLTKF